jgi:predicted pyridoxine 5'-phosphate oxidase superfamily flavin-nucleotide-binding protein
MSSVPSAPFHCGEIAVQTRVGVRERLAETGPRIIRDHMPEQHRELFGKLPAFFIGSLDSQRRPWASLLVGHPGFISTPNERTLRIAQLPTEGDPLRENLLVNAPLGGLGLEPQTRRRNRVNGTLIDVRRDGFTLHVAQSFGNCPKYIHAREPHWIAGAQHADAAQHVCAEGTRLSQPAAHLVSSADTLFIASSSANARGDAGAQGVDISHRGGPVGFVQLGQQEGDTTLTIADFVGNFLFNTLGNIVAYPRAGLLFVDYARGDMLQLAGRAEIIWDGPEVRAVPDAQRLLRITVETGWWRPQALPLRWSAVPASAVSSRTLA